MIHSVIQQIKRVPYLRSLYYSELGQWVIEAPRWHLLRPRAVKANWSRRTEVLLQAGDNASIPRVVDAGRIIDGCLIMHNGLRVRPDSYYNYAALRMMQRNRGVHEPQEEHAFQEVLKHVPPGATMVELGAYWGFYSMWFCKAVPRARAILVEPLASNLSAGRENFRLNGLDGNFVHAVIGDPVSAGRSTEIPVVTIDRLMSDIGIDRIDILHSDIQGDELKMLAGCERAVAAGHIGWMFVSTHSDDLHNTCRQWLVDRDFQVVCEHNRDESYSVDGLIVVRHASACGPSSVPISIRCRRQPRTPAEPLGAGGGSAGT